LSGKRGAVSSVSLTSQDSTGTPLDLRSETPPQEGDELQNNGDTWTVEEVGEDDDGNTVVKLRPVPKSPETDVDG
jgi:hypothetical protein